jgi:kinesin family protein C2/C3
MEIEQLLKDKSKSPSSSTDRNDSSHQIRRLSGNGSLRSCDKISSWLQNYVVVNVIGNGHTSSTGTGVGSCEAECEDNVSDDSCSVAGTEYSVGGASEATAEQMYVVTVAF